MATFYDHFRECAEQRRGNVALEIQRQDRVESYTYAEVQRGAESIGRWLVDNGLKPGDRTGSPFASRALSCVAPNLEHFRILWVIWLYPELSRKPSALTCLATLPGMSRAHCQEWRDRIACVTRFVTNMVS